MRTLFALLDIDRKNFVREPMLVYLAVIPLVTIALLRWAVPLIELRYAEVFKLEEYFPLLVSFFFILQLPLLFGCIIGLILIEEREEGAISAVRVTPLRLTEYLALRAVLPITISFLSILLGLAFGGLVPSLSWPFVAIGLVAALSSLAYALALPSYADNRIEGVALMKFFGIFLLGPGAAYFVSAEWQWLFGAFPTYWVAKATWVACAGGKGYVGYLLVGVLYTALVVLGLHRRLERRFN